MLGSNLLGWRRLREKLADSAIEEIHLLKISEERSSLCNRQRAFVSPACRIDKLMNPDTVSQIVSSNSCSTSSSGGVEVDLYSKKGRYRFDHLRLPRTRTRLELLTMKMEEIDSRRSQTQQSLDGSLRMEVESLKEDPSVTTQSDKGDRRSVSEFGGRISAVEPARSPNNLRHGFICSRGKANS
ncbi:unnamed protein product [Calicophoron daubneyi]|uniref:Uncharacterized protein n=1 Tax=Calicophoron daubneyi TaxID=300641 RepID=A0AAV2TKW5_CALDB